MGKSSPPPAPTPPTASEISAANIESAKGLKRLERAMQFGEELTKEGYVRQQLDVPQGAEPVYDYQDVQTSMPEQLIDQHNGGVRMKIGDDGKIIGVWPDIDNPDGDSEFMGMNWGEAEALQREQMDEQGYPNYWTVTDQSGQQFGTTQVQTLAGYDVPDGEGGSEYQEANAYFKINDDGTRTQVNRDEAIDADFTGIGDTDLARKKWEFEQETSPERAQFMLDLAEQYGPEFVDQAKDLIERSDPTGFAAREMLGELAQGYAPGELPAAPTLDEMGEYDPMEQVGDRPTLGEVSESPIYDTASELGDLGRITETPTYLESAAGPAYEQASAMDTLRRVGDAPSFEEIGDTRPDLERAAELDALTRLEGSTSSEGMSVQMS